MSKWDVLAYKDYQANPWNYVLDFKFGKGPTITLLYMNSTGNNWFGLSKLKNPFSKGNIGGPKGQAAMTAIGEGINLAGTALNKGVTNETGEILTTAGSGLMSIPTPYTKAIGVGLIGAGVVANGLTDRVNTKYLNAKNAEVNRIGNWTSLAGDYRGLQQEMSNFNTVDLGDLDNWGDVGFLSSGNKVRGARSTTERALLAATGMRQLGVNSRGQYINMMNTYNLLGNLIALGGSLDNVDPSTPIGYSIYTDRAVKDKLKDSSGMTNMFAGTPSIFGFGGGIFTKGANFDTGVSFINKGGTHEENPNDGVQMGVDSQGVPNLVEEGEVNWEDYIFSDRLIVPRGKRGNYGKRARKYAEGGKLAKGKGIDTPYESKVLKPYEGLTFAEAAKKIVKKNGADERKDAITMRGVNAQLSVLAGILEKEREKEKLREMQETIDNMSPEEFAMLQQLMEAQLAALQQQEMAMQQLQMIPEGMELMLPVEQQQPIAALGGLLNTPDNMYPYGGNLKLFRKDLKDANVSEEDYLRAFYNMRYDKLYEEAQDKDNILSKEEFVAELLEKFKLSPEEVLNDENFNKDFAETFLNRVETITKQYNRRAKKQGIKVDNLLGATKAQYNRDLNQAILKGLTDADYDVALDTELTFNNSNVAKAKDKQAAYNNAATYNDLIARGGRAVELDDLGRPTWESITGLNRIDNSDDNFYTNLGDLNGTALEDRGIYDYNAAQKSSIDVDDYKNVKLRGWNKNEDGTYTVSSEYDNPNQTSLNPGNSSTTYPIADIGDLKPGSEEYVAALKAIQDNKDYLDQTKYVKDALESANGDIDKLKEEHPDVLNYIQYLDANSGNVEGKLIGEDGKLSKTAIKDYERRRTDSEYGIYHYQFDKGSKAAANRYYYKDKDKDGKDVKIYISKPKGTDFTISGTPTVVTGTDGTLFNDYEVTGLNKRRTLTQLPTGEIVDVTDVADLPNWKKLDKPVLVDNTDNLGYGIKGTTDWVDYESSPMGQKVIEDENDTFPKPSNGPFGLAALVQLGVLGNNILSPIDYSNADALSSAAKLAGVYTPISPLFAGQRLPYEPAPDTKFGKIIGVGLGNAKNIINNSRGNIGATLTGLLLNAFNTQLALSEADEAWRQGNWNMLKDVLTFGLQRDTSNYDRDLKAKMSNQDAESRAAGYTLEGTKHALAMRQAMKDARDNAISAEISGLINTGLAYGLNKWNQDVFRWRLKHNQYPISLLEGDKYKLDPEWEVKDGYLVKRAKGGKLKRRHKGLGF